MTRATHQLRYFGAHKQLGEGRDRTQSPLERLPRLRLWIVSAAMALALVLSVSGVGGCSPRGAGESELLMVGIPTDRMSKSAAEQIGQNWCWAACIQMVLSARGVESDQPTIVQRTFGSLLDMPGSSVDIGQNLTGWFESKSGRTFLTASVVAGHPKAGLLYSYLRGRMPVILAIQSTGATVGHAVVVTAAVFKTTPHGLEIREVVIRDPSPEFASTSGRRTLSEAEFSSTGWYVLVDVIRSK